MRLPLPQGLVGVTLAFAIGCQPVCDAAPPTPAVGDLAFGFEGAITDWPGGGEGTDETSLASSPEVARRGASSARVRVRQGDFAGGGNRAELTWDNGDLAGAEAIYAWSVYLPVEWPDIDSVRDAEGRPNWQIIGQWHDQPNAVCGETWDDLPGNSPPISIQYLYLSSTDPDPELQELLESPSAIPGLDASALDRPLLAFVAGVPPELRAVVPIEKGQWIDLQMRIVWSRGPDGEAELMVDGATITRFDGANMWNDVSHYFKTGLYRNPTIAPDQTLFIDEILVTRDRGAAAAHEADLAASR